MIEERIEKLKNEIAEKQAELSKLNDELLTANENDIHKQFIIWANNGLEKEQSYLPSQGSALRNWLDENVDIGSMRGCVYLFDYDDTFGMFSIPVDDLDEECLQYIDELKKDTLFVNACKYMIEENIDSFEIDW